jgi:hypothetical protein
VVQALDEAFPAAQLGNAGLAVEAIRHDANLLLGRILLARGASNVLEGLLGTRLGFPGYLSHLHSLAVTRSQKSSSIQ